MQRDREDRLPQWQSSHLPKWSTATSQIGKTEAQLAIARMYLNQRNFPAALDLLKQAAKQGNVEAQGELAVLRQQGRDNEPKAKAKVEHKEKKRQKRRSCQSAAVRCVL